MTQPTTPTRRSDVDAAFRGVLRAERALLRALGRSPEDLEQALRLAEGGRVLLGAGNENVGELREAIGHSAVRAFRLVARLRLSRSGLLGLLQVARTPVVRRAAEAALDARDLVVELNQGLIARRIFQMLTGHDRGNVDLCEEAQQQASLDLLGSVDRFQPRFGFAFSTFALPAMERAIRETRDTFRSNLRVPDEVRGLQVAYLRKESEMLGRLGRLPSRTEVAEALGQPLGAIERMQGAVGFEERLDEPCREEGGQAPIQDLPDPGAGAPSDEGLDTRQLGGWVQGALGCLSGLQAKVLAIRFGFEGEAFSRPQAAQALGLTPAQVTRLEREGLQGVLRGLGPLRGAEIRRQLGVAEVCA